VTGSCRGIGRATAKLLAMCEAIGVVIITSREQDSGMKERDKLQNEIGGNTVIEYIHLDCENETTFNYFISQISTRRIDILVNNAGILLEPDVPLGEINIEKVYQTYNVNTMAPLKICIALLKGMKERNYGRIVNVSSGIAQMNCEISRNIGYRLSKVGLNTLTRMIDSDCINYNIICNSVTPGFTKTDMTTNLTINGQSATRIPEKGAAVVVFCATMSDYEKRGLFWKESEENPGTFIVIPW